MSIIEVDVTTHHGAATRVWGRQLGEILEPGDLIFLRGDLGGGKTTFTQGIMAGLGHPEPREVTSPTYALHHRYRGGRLTVEHLDLYRIQNAQELEQQGVLDPLLHPGAVVVVEWAERLPSGGQGPALEIMFGFVDLETRRLTFRFHGSRGRAMGEALGLLPTKGDASAT